MRKFVTTTFRPFRSGRVFGGIGFVIVLAGILFVGGTVVGSLRDPESVRIDPVQDHAQEAFPYQGASAPEGDLLFSDWGTPAWIYAAYAVAGGGLVFVLVQWRTAYLDRRREELERQVIERTREVHHQKRQLETYNEELLRTNDQLRKLIEEKSQLLGIAAHDLKNPLFGIRALSEILLEREKMSDGMERKLGLIYDSADDTLRLIDQLLTSAASSAESRFESEPVDIGALTKWVVHSFEPHVERKDQQLHCEVASDDCVVEGDKRKLREAISNLVSNAVKYTPQGGTVDVQVERDNEGVRVDVSDTGPGLSLTDQERLFVPFQRLSPEPTGGESSSGLGLFIVKEVVEQHDGTINLDSAPGEGATFTIHLPASPLNTGSVPDIEPSSQHAEG